MKLKSNNLLIAFIVMLSTGLSQMISSPVQAMAVQTDVYHPTEDTYVRGNAANTAYGSSEELVVKLKGVSEGSNTNRVALLKFDFGSLEGQAVEQATLRLYATKADDSSGELDTREFKLFGISHDSWTEEEATWNNAPHVGGEEIGIFSVSEKNIPQWYEVDITEYINSQMDAKQVSFRLECITPHAKSMVYFASNDANENKPELVLHSAASEPTNTAPAATDISIGGTAKVGGALTGNYTFTDPDGDEEGTSVYKWMMADAEDGEYSAIEGATEKTLLLAPAHAGKFIRFEVTPVDEKGLAGETAKSAIIMIEAADQNGVYHPTIDTYVQGNSSASKKNEKELVVKLKGANEAANTNRVALMKFDYSNFAGHAVKQAVIRLYATDADTLETRDLVLFGIPYDSWQEDIASLGDIPIESAKEIRKFSVSRSEIPKWYEIDVTDYINSQMDAKQVSFKLDSTTADEKSKVSFASNEADNHKPELLLYSFDSEPENAAPAATDVIISGLAKVGETLTGVYAFTDPDGDKEGASVYRWLMADAEDGEYTVIEGAREKTLLLTSSHADKFIRFEVTPVDDKGLAGKSERSTIKIEALNKEKDFTVEASFNLEALEPNKSLIAHVTAVNHSNHAQDVLVIVALYDQDGTMINVSYSSKNVLAGENDKIIAGFKLPGNIDNYIVKVFVWEGTDIESSNMTPISNIAALST